MDWISIILITPFILALLFLVFIIAYSAIKEDCEEAQHFLIGLVLFVITVMFLVGIYRIMI